MDDVDLPHQSPTMQKLDKDLRIDLRAQAEGNLYMFAKGILGYKDMTAHTHGPLCAFLQHNPKRFKRVLYPRDHYKTTVATIAGGMWKALRNPNERILIANESATNAQRMLGVMRQQFESNRTLRVLFSDLIPKNTRDVGWNNIELNLNRTEIYPEPTFDTIGMTGSVTSRHYSHMIFDDPISEEAVKSEKVMKDVINRMSAVTALLSKPEIDTIWLIGTRWALHDVYSWFDRSFGDRVGKFSRSVLEDGLPIFPELLSLETIALKRAIMGSYKFSCLMMNNPRNENLQDLDPAKVRYWRWYQKDSTIELLHHDLQPTGEIVALSDLDITITVDLAPAEKANSDRNAVVTLGVAPSGSAIVLDLFARRCTPLEVINHIFALHAQFSPISKLGIESVAYQKAFKYFLRDEADRRGVFLPIVELKSTGRKEIRVRGLQPVLGVGRLYVNPKDQLLLDEIADFPLGEHDDCVDALSMHLQIAQGWFNTERHERYLKAEAEMIAEVWGRSGGTPIDTNDEIFSDWRFDSIYHEQSL